MSNRPLVLVTNDDGVGAPGLACLVSTLETRFQVAVVAPDRERSGVARAISLGRPLRARPMGSLRWAVDGTPTDCVYLAVHELLPQRPDLVVSGINRGPNLADDVTYSGTVAGAMEAALVGIRSIAVSLDGYEPLDYQPAAQFALSVSSLVIERGLPQRSMLNVNVPNTQGAPIRGFRWTRGGRRHYGHQVTVRVDPRAQPYYWIGGNILDFESVTGSDCDAVAEGLASVTPLNLDLTHTLLLDELQMLAIPGYERS